MKVCSKCNVGKPLSEYHKLKPAPDGHRPECKTCRRALRQAWYAKHAERQKAKSAAYREANPDKVRCCALRNKYGITLKQYNTMLAQQDHKCAICRTADTSYGVNGNNFAVDHCHTTGEVRGLLCGQCNIGLGAFSDSEDSLHAAIDYLRRKT